MRNRHIKLRNWHNRACPRRRFTPAAELLDDRTLLSGSVTGGVVGAAVPRHAEPSVSSQRALRHPSGVPHTVTRQSGLMIRPTIRGAIRITPPSRPPRLAVTLSVAPAVPANAPIIIQSIINLTNQARRANHAPALTENSSLTAAAMLHSQDMAAANTMAHTIPGVGLPALTDRAAAVHYSYAMLGENIAYNQPDAVSVVGSWMNSLPHRENMLNPSFTNIGVGLAWNQRGEPYYTMMLGRPA
jgi:uncharacterized protein YkwD